MATYELLAPVAECVRPGLNRLVCEKAPDIRGKGRHGIISFNGVLLERLAKNVVQIALERSRANERNARNCRGGCRILCEHRADEFGT